VIFALVFGGDRPRGWVGHPGRSVRGASLPRVDAQDANQGKRRGTVDRPPLSSQAAPGPGTPTAAVGYALEWWRVAEQDADSLHERVGGEVDVVALWRLEDQAREIGAEVRVGELPKQVQLQLRVREDIFLHVVLKAADDLRRRRFTASHHQPEVEQVTPPIGADRQEDRV
jgi:hypothetical protein